MRWVRSRFRGLNLLQKSLLIYVFLSLIPTIALGALFYQNLNDDLMESQREQRQNMLDQAGLSYANHVTSIESVPNLIQSNSLIREYLSGEMTSVSEEVATFIQYVKPGLGYIYLSYPDLTNIRVYNGFSYSVETYNPVRPYGDLDPALRAEILNMRMDDTMWVASSDAGRLRIHMYKPLLNSTYTRRVGILELEVSPEKLLAPFTGIVDNRMFFEADGALFGYEGGGFAQIRALPGGAPVENRIALAEPPITVHMQALSLPYPDRQIKLFIVQMAVLFALISLQYALFTFTFERRLRRFAQHIDSTSNALQLYDAKPLGHDEIDRTIRAYNAMTEHIRDLIQNEYMMVIKKREADYYALQAQIKPHFIFNTLENIRMGALISGDVHAADMLCALADFIRYNAQALTRTTLGRELENARQYLNIFSYRIGDALRWSERVEMDVQILACPQFILQPIIENTIEHGFAEHAEEMLLDIHIYDKGQDVYVVIRDNGAGIPAEKLRAIREQLARDSEELFSAKESAAGGIGLRNVDQRVKLFFGPDCGLSIDSREHSFTECTLHIKKITL